VRGKWARGGPSAWSNPPGSQANGVAQIFKPAIDQIQSQTQISILLPSRLPAGIRERDIKSTSGTVSESGYYISLYCAEEGSEASFAAGFGGFPKLFRDLLNTRGRPSGWIRWNV